MFTTVLEGCFAVASRLRKYTVVTKLVSHVFFLFSFFNTHRESSSLAYIQVKIKKCGSAETRVCVGVVAKLQSSFNYSVSVRTQVD